MTNDSMNLSLSVNGHYLVLNTDGNNTISVPLDGARITSSDLLKMLKNMRIRNLGIMDFIQTIEIEVSGGYRVCGAYTFKPRFVFLIKIEKERHRVPYSYCSGNRGSTGELHALQNFMTQSWRAPEVVDFYFSPTRRQRN